MKRLFFSLAILTVVVVNSIAGTKQGQLTAYENETKQLTIPITETIDGKWFGLSADAYSRGNDGFAEAEAYFTLINGNIVSRLYAKAINKSFNLNSYYFNPYRQGPHETSKHVKSVFLKVNTEAYCGTTSWADVTVSW